MFGWEGYSRRMAWPWMRLSTVVLLTFWAWGCGSLRAGGRGLHEELALGAPASAWEMRAESWPLGGGVTAEVSARRAEVERALAQLKAMVSGVRRVGTRLELRYWAESGALTLMGFHAEAGGSEWGERVVDPRKLEREVELALSGYGASLDGPMRIVLRRERAGWALEYATLRPEPRPAEARRLAVELSAVTERSYRAAHEVAERVLSVLRVPEGGEARQEVVVQLWDGRVVGWEQRLYEVVRGGGALRPVGPELVGQVTGLLLGFEEGLGPRTLRLLVRAEHRRGEGRAEGWVERAEVQRALSSSEMDEDFARSYQAMHEELLRRWRVELKEGALWLAASGAEELALWYAGGIVARGAGVLLELSLPVVRTALARGGAAATGWMRTALLRLTPDKRRAFEQLWSKVLLEGDAALTAVERDTLRGVMQDLERLARTPLGDAEKQALRRASRDSYKRLYPQLAELMDEKGSLLPIHHRRPLEYAHLFPADDINAAENLAMVRKAVHDRINAVWTRLRQTRGGATSMEEVEQAARIVDEWFKPWYHRIDDPPGVSYSLAEAEQQALKALQQLSTHHP